MAKTYGYLYDDKYKPTECIGSFGSDTDDGFKQLSFAKLTIDCGEF